MTMEDAMAARTRAQMELHWHLTRAAAFVIEDRVLGPLFEQEMLLAERARADWHVAQDEFAQAFNVYHNGMIAKSPDGDKWVA